MTVQLPFGGMLAPVNAIEFDVLVNDPLAPVQVEAGCGRVGDRHPVGSVSLKLLWVSVKAFALCNVKRERGGNRGSDARRRNACATVGGTGVTCSAVGHAVLPALAGALLDALFEVTVMVAVSLPPMLSVTVSVTVPAPGRIVALSLLRPETMLTPPLAVQEYVADRASARGRTAACVEHGIAAGDDGRQFHRRDGQLRLLHGLERVHHAGAALAAVIGAGALAAVWIVARTGGHSRGPGREWPVALDFRRAVSWVGVRLPLTERISPAMPETMGAEKLVPRFGFVSFV